MRGGFGGIECLRGGCGARAWTGPAFEAMMKGWMEEQETSNKENNEKEENKENKENISESSKNKNGKEKEETKSRNVEKEATSSEQEDMNETFEKLATMTGSAEYLKNVGNFVAAALDPFGIDVQVHVETPEAGSDIGSPGSSSTVDDKRKGQKSCDQYDNDIESSSEQDEGEWTVVAEKDVENGTSTSENNLYPSLENDSATTSAPSAAPATTPPTITASTLFTATTPTPSAPCVEPASLPAAVSHPDPKIQVAVQAMMNMGFTNEGGWLASLLEAKNGDIGKVLDILQTGTRRMY